MDGLDGAGKDTVAGILATLLALKDRSVAVRSHPSMNVFGRLSRAFLLGRGRLAHALATAFFGLDALTSTALLARLLRDHDVVIFVRYLLSAAYLPDALAQPVHDLFESFLPEPDVKVLVDTHPEVAMARIRERAYAEEMFENPEALRRVRRHLAELVDDTWTVVDNNGTFRTTREQVEAILPRISAGGRAGTRGASRAQG